MQAQAQISGQVPGQVAGQLAGVPQQNMNSLPSPGGWRRTWQTEADVTIRRMIVEKILLLFQKRKPHVSQDWQQKLPDFVKRLEESLYRDAVSKEEYADLSTLELRLQAVAKRMAPQRSNQNFASRGMNAASSMIPTPGMPSAANGSTMIPTPGNEINVVPTPGTGGITTNSGGLGSMLPQNSGGALLQGHGMASAGAVGNMVPTPGLGSHMFPTSVEPSTPMPGNSMVTSQGRVPISLGPNAQIMPNMGIAGAGSQMIPTPGLNSSQHVGLNANSSAGMAFSNVDTVAAVQLQQHQYNSGSSGHMYRNMNGQLGGSMSSNIQRKNPSFGFVNGGTSNGLQLMGNGQQLMNGNTSFSNATVYMNPPQYGNMQMQSQQHMNQQRQQHISMQSSLPSQISPLPGDGYAMNAADLAGPGSFYSPVSAGLSAGNLSMNSLGMQTPKMIPVPGLPSQQSHLQSPHQLQQPQSQALDKFQQINFQQNSSGLARGNHHHHHQQQQQHQHQQLPKSKVLYPAQLSSNLFGQKQPGIGLQQEETQPAPNSVPSLTPLFQSSPEQQQSHHLQHSQTMQHQQQQLVSHQQTPMPVLLQQQQMTQQTQSVNQQQLWPHQAQNDQQHQSTSKQQQHQQQHQHQQHQHQHQHPHPHPHPHPQQQQQQQQHQQQQQQQHQQQQQQSTFQHQGQQDVHLQQQRQLQQQKSQQPQNLQGIGQQPAQLSPQQPQPQDLSLEDAEEPQRSHQVTANGSITTAQTANGVDAINLPSNVIDEAQRAQQYLKQQRWLLFLRHASKCTAPEGQCQTTPHCHTARQLWGHITKCTDRECQYARCHGSRTLLKHHQQCRDPHCPVCGPVRQKFLQQRTQAQGQAVQGHSASSLAAANVASGACRPSSLPGGANVESPGNKFGALPNSAIHVQPPPAKRAKIEPTEQMDIQQSHPTGATKNQTTLQVPPQAQTAAPGPSAVKSEVHAATVKTEVSGPGNLPVKLEAHASPIPNATVQRSVQVKTETSSQAEAEPGFRQVHPITHAKIESSGTTANKGSVQVKQEVVASASPSTGQDSASIAKSNKSKIKGVSLTELFTPEQIREHILGLRQWVGQSKAKAEKNQAMEHRMSENSCQLCAVETLTFEPPPIYCTPCGARIKRNALYWTMGSGETRHYFCIPCYNEARSDTVELDGVNYPKSKLERRKNDEETEEPWVQCDKCEKWQHQVCALFNTRRNEGGQAEYTCPHCLVGEIEKGERKPLPQSAVLGAKDLPRTLLSDHIEQRLARRLKSERHDRARAQGKSYDEVPGADSLVIRVVSSVDKKLEVKQRFLEIFQEEDYPTEFPYKSKVLLLFQKIEGVEVCLFGMYVQEFGAECAQPNQRRVYLSYLDSVKYFRPDVRTVTGEALRTYVYHEILIGYLDYCKKRGFTSCYIWACPPLKGEDYILYCHPEIQKTPKSDKLREWYLTMLRKATGEDIVMEVTNLYDHFFVCTGEAKAKVTAARLPYFDGDYWPGAAEDMIMQLQEEEDGRRQQKKGKTKKTATKRATKAAAQAELASNASKDLQLMHKLGESIYPMKEDFIMVHMNYACTHCCNFIVSGHRWVCKQCKNFHICDRCYEAEQKLDERDRHPENSKEAHQLYPEEVNEVLADTKDKDEIMESEFFDTRQAFLSLCQGNHYQYDTLRRAKHSSMMVLYHLHNPTAPAFVTTCNMCHRDIETGQGWRCETCPDFDLCNACYSKNDSVKHPHKLSPHPSVAEREAQSKEARQQRVLQLRKMLDLLVHASQCGSAQCQYPNCRRVKGLFRHGMICKTRASGGCHLCKKMWYLLQLHARACKESECRVPRCKDLKEHLRRLQQQMESRRRAAVMEMMRQRAAEAAGSTG